MEGVLEAVAILPRTLELVAAGSDWVTGISTDQLGVERVARGELTAGEAIVTWVDGEGAGGCVCDRRVGGRGVPRSCEQERGRERNVGWRRKGGMVGHEHDMNRAQLCTTI